MSKLNDEQCELVKLAADIGAAAAREYTLTAEAGIAKKLEGMSVKFTHPDKAPFIEAAAKFPDLVTFLPDLVYG